MSKVTPRKWQIRLVQTLRLPHQCFATFVYCIICHWLMWLACLTVNRQVHVQIPLFSFCFVSVALFRTGHDVTLPENRKRVCGTALSNQPIKAPVWLELIRGVVHPNLYRNEDCCCVPKQSKRFFGTIHTLLQDAKKSKNN